MMSELAPRPIPAHGRSRSDRSKSPAPAGRGRPPGGERRAALTLALLAPLLAGANAAGSRTAGPNVSGPVPGALATPALRGVAAPSAASLEGWEDDLREAQEQLVVALDDVATWCGERKLFATRDEIFHLILRYDPEHFRAHKGLKHTQDRDGNWHLPTDPMKKSLDRNKAELPDAERMRDEATGAYREACLALLEREEGTLSELERDEVLESVLWIMPDDAELHALRGEELDPVSEEWVLRETVAARKRRGELREYALRALEESESYVEKAAIADDEAGIGVEWGSVTTTPAVRVVGTGGADETRQVARASHAMGDFFRDVFQADTEQWDDLTVFVLREPSERDRFLDGYGLVPPEMRDTYRTFVGTGFPKSANVAVWQSDPLERLDFATRHALGGLLTRGFGITPAHAWVWEGLGLYLNRRIVRTRFTWYSTAPGSAEVQALRLRLADPEGNWMGEAHELLSSGVPLGDLLGKDLSQMSASDMALSYAFAAFLVEAHSDVLATLLERIGSGGQPSADVVSELTGMDLEVLQRRLVRWLEERQ